MKKITFLIMLLACSVLVGAVSFSNINPGDLDDRENYFFTTLKENYATIGEGTAVFEINNQLDNLPVGKALNTQFITIKGEGVNRYELYLETTIEEETPIYTLKAINKSCDYIDNDTMRNVKRLCPDFTNTQTGVKKTTKKINKLISENTILPKGTYKITLKAYWSVGLGENVIEWIPRINLKRTDYPALTKDYSYSHTEWATWYSTYQYRRNITCTSLSAGTPFSVNGSNGFYIENTQFIVWTTCNGTGLALYYNNATSLAIANATNAMPYEVEKGGAASNNPSGVWKSGNYKAVYHFNDTIKAYDSSGNELHGNNSGLTTGTSCFFGNCYKYDGKDDFTNLTEFINAENMLSIYLCANNTKIVSGQGMVTKWGDDTRYNWRLGWSAGNKLYWHAYNSAGTQRANAGTIDQLNKKFCTTATYDGRVMRLYEDDKGGGATAVIVAPLRDISMNLLFGANVRDNYFYNGTIDEIRIRIGNFSLSEINQTVQNRLNGATYGMIGVQEEYDFTLPNIAIKSPLNNKIYNVTTILLNITATDSHLDKVFYHWNGTNYTYTAAGNIGFTPGDITLHAYANDTYGNINHTSIAFKIDIKPPNINILKPEAITYTTLNISVNLSIFDNLAVSRVWYNFDNGTNYTYNGVTTKLLTSWGDHYIYVFANDTAGNRNQTFRQFTTDPGVENPSGFKITAGLEWIRLEWKKINSPNFSVAPTKKLNFTGCNITFTAAGVLKAYEGCA